MNEVDKEIEKVDESVVIYSLLKKVLDDGTLDEIAESQRNGDYEKNFKFRIDLSFNLLKSMLQHVENMRLNYPEYDLLKINGFYEDIFTLPIFTHWEKMSKEQQKQLETILDKYHYTFDPVKKEITYTDRIRQDKYSLPVNRTINNTKVSHKIFDIDSQDLIINPTAVDVIGKNKPEDLRKEKAVYFQNFTNSNRFNRFDEIVFSGITTIYEQDFSNFSANTLARVIGGKSENNPNSALIKEIRESINKMRTTLIYLDYTRHVGEPGNNKYIFNDTLLNLQSVILIDDNGNEIEGYKFKEDIFSPLHKYRKDVNQIINIPFRSFPMNMNKQTIQIKDYIEQRVHSMIHRSQTKVIVFRTVANKTETPYKTKTEKSRLREKCCKILDELIKDGTIKDYELLKDKREITKAQVKL